jgi:hypothetical protein
MKPRFTREPKREEIATLAYFLWEEEGRPSGKDVEHWLSAMAHVCADDLHQPPEAPASRKNGGKNKQ